MIRRISLLYLLFAAACNHKIPPEEVTPATNETQSASATSRWIRAKKAKDLPLEQQPARVLAPPDAIAAISPALPSRIEKIHTAVGDKVRKGDTLFTVLVPEATTAIAIQSATGPLIQALERRREQLRTLRAEGLARSSDLFTVEVELARAQAERARAAATLRGIGGSATALKSPIDGIVTELQSAIGEWRRPEEGPLARVVDPRAHRVEARFSEPPSPKENYALEQGRERIPLQFIGSAPRTDGEAQGTYVWFSLPENVQVFPTQIARVVLLPPDDVLLVEARALLYRQGKASVLARKDGQHIEIPVEVLRVSGGHAWIKGNLSEDTPISTTVSAELPEAP